MSGVSAVIVAAGRGERLGSAKQFLPLGGIPILLWSVRALGGHPEVDDLVVVLPEEMTALPDWLAAEEKVRICAGGETRRQSAGAGVIATSPEARIIMIHDAARPFVSRAVVDRVLAATVRTGAALPVVPVVDTIKRTGSGLVVETLDRSSLARAQTPQGFEASLIRALHGGAAGSDASAPDDVTLCELEGHPVAVVEGDPWNLKITTPADLALAEWLVGSGRVSPPLSGGSSSGDV